MRNFLAECAASRRRPFNPGRRHRAGFARRATIDAFGWGFARALDQADFVDRSPGESPRLIYAPRSVVPLPPLAKGCGQ